MANKEDYLDALSAYSKNPSRDIPAVLEQFLNSVAKNGETLFHWHLLKPLIVGKMDQVIGELRQRLSSEHIPDRPNVENVRFDVMRDRIMDALNKFNGAPFTIQRLCELLVDPKRHYRRSDKFLRGLEKNVLVVSTVDPFGRKVVSESGIKHLVNGIDSNGSPFFPRDSNTASNLPPVPGWVTTASPRPQSTPKIEASRQKPPEQTSPTSSIPTSGGGSSNDSLDADQKETVVHSEVVGEETVVTMDTSEPGTVATDGGEAMAEVDDNEEDMQDDTAASSSSSSPEEPPVSDAGSMDSYNVLPSDNTKLEPACETDQVHCCAEAVAPEVKVFDMVDSKLPVSIKTEQPEVKLEYVDQDKSETSDAQTETNSAVTSSTQPSTYTSDSNGTESESMDTSSSDCHQYSSDSPASSRGLQPPSDEQTEFASSSEASSLPEESSEKGDLIEPFAESNSESASCSSHDQESSGSSRVSGSDTGETAATLTDLQVHGSDNGDSCSTTASEMESDSSPKDTDGMPSSSDSSSSDTDLKSHEPSPSNTSSLTEVVASSTTDLLPSIKPFVCAETQDSVAGLERLVDSVDTSVLQAPFSSVSILPPLTSSHEKNSVSSPLSSFDSSLDCEESETKQHRVSAEERSSSLSNQVSASSEAAASSSDCTSIQSDTVADTTSDPTVKGPNAPSEEQKAELSESLTSVSCSAEDTDDSSIVSSDNGISRPPQLSSPSDSQGFDITENASCNNVDDK